MAELFLAENTERGEQVVIKRILPYLSHEAEFVQMFLDEARIAAQLHHPCIIRIDELGKLNDSIFMAMEYVNGVDLRKILQEEVKLGLTVPYGIVAYVTAQVCAGLHYAHNCQGMDGKPLGVIHRDVSPQNVMVSFDGWVKLVDFGIAKASALVERSKPGVIKGKFLYLSPEQLSQERLDHRADLFAIGTMMYELATGKSPFYKSTTEAVIYAIRSEDPPPPELVRSDFPAELSRIVMKCLVKDRNRRYQQAAEIQRDLEAFIREEFPTDTSVLASYVSQLFGEAEGKAAPAKAAPQPPAAKPSQQVLVPAAKRVTADKDVEVSSDAAPTAHASAEEVARAQQLAAVRSGIMAALPHRKSMRHEQLGGGKKHATVTMRGSEKEKLERAERADRAEKQDRGDRQDRSGPIKSTPSRPAMGALAPPPLSPAPAARAPSEPPEPMTNPSEARFDENETMGDSDPEGRMTAEIPDGRQIVRKLPPSAHRAALPLPPLLEADDDDDSEEGNSTASILPGQLTALPVRRPAPPKPPARHPMLVAGISFAVVLILGIILLLVLRGRAPAPSGSSAPPPPGQGAAAPGTSALPGGEAGRAPAAAEERPAARPVPGVLKVPVMFRAPARTIILHQGQRYAPEVTFRLEPGVFTFEYRCPGRSSGISTSVTIEQGRTETQIVPLSCPPGR
jgi:serine/threonine-protein kinase